MRRAWPKQPSLVALYTELNLQFWDGSLPASRASAKYYGGTPRERGVVVRRVSVKYYGRGLRSRDQMPGHMVAGQFHPAKKFSPASINILPSWGEKRSTFARRPRRRHRS